LIVDRKNKNLVEAMKCYKLSADTGNSNGMNHYGLGLDNGFLEKLIFKRH
jgi:hypothetical protein